MIYKHQTRNTYIPQNQISICYVAYNLHNQIIVEKTAANAGYKFYSKQSEILKCKSTKSTFQLKIGKYNQQLVRQVILEIDFQRKTPLPTLYCYSMLLDSIMWKDTVSEMIRNMQECIYKGRKQSIYYVINSLLSKSIMYCIVLVVDDR